MIDKDLLSRMHSARQRERIVLCIPCHEGGAQTIDPTHDRRNEPVEMESRMR